MNAQQLKHIPTLRELDFLAKLTSEALSSLQLRPLLWRIVQLLRDEFDFEFAAIGIIEQNHIIIRAASGLDVNHEVIEAERNSAWVIPIGRGVVGTVAKKGEPSLVNKTSQSEIYIEAPELGNVQSELAVPVIYRERVIGVIDVAASTGDSFDERSLRLLQIIATLIAPAIHTAQLYERERKRVRYLHLANEISSLVMSSLDREHMMSTTCQAMLETLDVSFVAIILVNRAQNRVIQGGYASRAQFSDGVDFEHWSIALGEGIVSETINKGRPTRVSTSPKHDAYRELVLGVQSHLSVPLRIQGEVIGALVIEHVEEDRFTEEEERILENISAYIAQAIDNARLFDGQRRRWLQLLMINEVARVATRTVDLDQIVKLVTREIHERFGYFVAALMLREDKDLVLKAISADGELDIDPDYREAIGEGIAGAVAKTGLTLQVGEADEFGLSKAFCEGIQSGLCVPLSAGDSILGVIMVQSLNIHAFDDEDRVMLETLAKSVSGSIANAIAIREKEQLREDLNRMVVHDLRNPIQTIQLTLNEVLRTEEISDKLKNTVSESIKGSDDILDMVNSLLDLARFEAGKASLKIRPAVLNDHIREAMRRLAPIARSKRIQVMSILSSDIPVMRFDHELIDRMLTNLIGNALKFTSDRGTITVSTEPIEEGWQGLSLPAVAISIRDTGEGIPKAYHEKIFEKFGQVESRKAGLKMSTGLGLALCRYVAEAHQGQIKVESELGKGSNFIVGLPVGKKKISSL